MPSSAMSDSVYGTAGSGSPASTAPQHRHRVDAHAVELGRQAAVAVVEADDEAARRRRGSSQKLVVPRDHLGGEAHHQQQRRVVGRAERVVLDRRCVVGLGGGHRPHMYVVRGWRRAATTVEVRG